MFYQLLRRVDEISNYNCRFICLSFQIYQFGGFIYLEILLLSTHALRTVLFSWPFCYVLLNYIYKISLVLKTFLSDTHITVGFPGWYESSCKTGDLGLIPGSGRSLAEGNGNPLQYSWLGNAIDRGAWWATVHESQSQTWLSDYTTTIWQPQPSLISLCDM